MKPDEYEDAYKFNAEKLAEVEAFADLHFQGEFTTARMKGGGWIGCFGPAVGLTQTHSYANMQREPDKHEPAYCCELLILTMASFPVLYLPRGVIVPDEAYFINSAVSRVEMCAALMHQGQYSILRTEDGLYTGAYGAIKGTTASQRAQWIEYPDLETLLTMMEKHPDEHTVNGYSADSPAALDGPA